MNAFARREDLLACLDCASPGVTGIQSHRTHRRPSALGWMLLTGGLACGVPVQALAADSSASDTFATAAATADDSKAPTPPLPPSLPDVAPPAKAADKPTTKPPVQKRAEAEDKTRTTTPWQTITGWLSSPIARAQTPAQPNDVDSPKPLTATVVLGTSPARTLSTNSSRPTTGGRFDPEYGPAGHFVTDADDQTVPFEAMPRVALPRQVPTSEPQQQTEQTAVATDESVSLVSWLSNYASGGHTHGGNSEACPDVCLTDNCCPTWEAQVDALFLWQGNIPSRPLFLNTDTGATALNANQLYGPAAIAPRYAFIYNRDQCRAIEVNYFQVWGFNGQQQLAPGAYTATNLVSNPPFDAYDSATVTSSAHIQSFEVNLRRGDGGMIQWISGFRWLEWGEQLNIDSTSTEGPAPIQDIVNVNTLNNLYGWQWGGDVMLWNAGRWLRVNGIGKAGVYYNHQAAQNTYTNFSDPASTYSSANDTVSFVGETGINASLALTNWLSWRAGYTCFWLGGVATSARQLGLTDVVTGTTSVNTNGSVFLHGVTTGLEARW